MARRERLTTIDYLVIGLSPALIMTLVGSLVFFLLELFYDGQFALRLRYILSLFVFAAVLVGRISIEDGRQRAALFSIPLAIATVTVIQRFADLWLLWSAILIAIVWWCADRLTWNCTAIDTSEDVVGEGLLQTMGFDQAGQVKESPEANQPQRPFWKRLFMVDHTARTAAPGVWVVYFSLAALPIFGIGQRFIPASNLDSRQRAFSYLVVYLASGLGLLLATGLLGLRRYLRRRGIEMPARLAGVWIATGAALTAGLLILAMLLPRPSAEFAISQLPTFGSPTDLQPNRFAPPGEGVESEDKSLGSGRGKSEVGEDGKGDPQGPPASDSEGGKSAQGEGQDDSSGTDDGEKGDSAKADSESGESNEGEADEKAADERSDENRNESKSNSSRRSSSVKPQDIVHTVQQGAGKMLKLLFYLIAAVLILWALWRYRHELWAGLLAFIAELRTIFASLFGGRKSVDTDDGQRLVTAMPAEPTRPFADFSNPFSSGMAENSRPEEVVQYTFEALEAWAREMGFPRDPEQTPAEFAQNVARNERAISREAQNVAGMYARVAYGEDSLEAESLELLKGFWRQVSA